MSDNMNNERIAGQSRIMNALDVKRTFPSNEDKAEPVQTQEKKYKIEQYINEEVEPLNKFNWGAFLIPPIWGLLNAPIACLTVLLAFIPFVGSLLALGFAIYCGIKGNEWAWEHKEWVDMRQFHETQKKWAIGALIAHLVFMVAGGIGAIIFFNTMAKAFNGI